VAKRPACSLAVRPNVQRSPAPTLRSQGLLQIPVGSIKLRRMDDLTVWQALLTVHNGRTISGSYAVQHGMVRVKAARGEKARRLDEGLHPIWLAGRLLSELAAEGNA
jgi:hypothetical protein